LYLWGAQLEAGSFPTPYIKTEATTATRNASVAVINDIDESEWFNPNEGTIIADFTPENDGLSGVFELRGGASPFVNFIYLRNTTTNRMQAAVRVSSGTAITATSAIDSRINGRNKVSLRYTQNTISLSANGQSVVTASHNGLPFMDRLLIGIRDVNYLNGNIANIQYYPTAVSDAKLQELSTL
jgi:hypothetical protein